MTHRSHYTTNCAGQRRNLFSVCWADSHLLPRLITTILSRVATQNLRGYKAIPVPITPVAAPPWWRLAPWVGWTDSQLLPRLFTTILSRIATQNLPLFAMVGCSQFSANCTGKRRNLLSGAFRALTRREERKLHSNHSLFQEAFASSDCRKTPESSRGPKPSRTFNRAQRRVRWARGYFIAGKSHFPERK